MIGRATGRIDPSQSEEFDLEAQDQTIRDPEHGHGE